jgi:hypothetical protein
MAIGTTTRSVLGIVIAIMAMIGSAVVIHASSVGDVCSQWSSEYNDPDNHLFAGCQSTGFWQWSAGWDFTGMNDEDQELATANDFCNSFVNACWDDCDSADYKQWVLDTYYDQNSCSYSISCIEAVGNGSCPDATSGSGSCSCMAFNVCAPC